MLILHDYMDGGGGVTYGAITEEQKSALIKYLF
jgi:hypothetical protein